MRTVGAAVGDEVPELRRPRHHRRQEQVVPPLPAGSLGAQDGGPSCVPAELVFGGLIHAAVGGRGARGDRARSARGASACGREHDVARREALSARPKCTSAGVSSARPAW
jgi:hypothetical protein